MNLTDEKVVKTQKPKLEILVGVNIFKKMCVQKNNVAIIVAKKNISKDVAKRGLGVLRNDKSRYYFFLSPV